MHLVTAVKYSLMYLGKTVPYFKNNLNVCSVTMSQKYGGP